MDTPGKPTLRYRVFRIVEADHKPLGGLLFDALLIALILANVGLMIFETEAWCVKNCWHHGLFFFEAASIAVFSVEYFLRIWVCPEHDPDRPAWRLRLDYITSFYGITDLLAVLPAWAALFNVAILDMRSLRIIRLLRLVKLTRYFNSIRLVMSVLRENAATLGAVIFLILIVIILASTGIYHLEKDVQPEAFGSIGRSMWWAFVTLTTVGYGDVVPVTAGGKVFASFITILSMGLVALPAGIMASAFSAKYKENRIQYLRIARRYMNKNLSEEQKEDLLHKGHMLGLTKNQVKELLFRELIHIKHNEERKRRDIQRHMASGYPRFDSTAEDPE
jgi:voltage-gated potassium channel